MDERERTQTGAIVRTEEAMVTRHEGVLDIEPARARQNLAAIKQFQAVVREVLSEGSDYGTIPGTQKPTLLKPGAEKITKLLNLFEEYEFVERMEDWDRPLFHYIVRCTLRDIATGARVASGLGECNSRESRYRYRWVREDAVTEAERATCPKKGGKISLFEPGFAIEKKETSGQYGKPVEHWAMFEEAIANRTARAVVRKTKTGRDMPGFEVDVDTTLYRVENPEIFDQVNTMVKIAKKRSHVDATLSAGRLSELFTQDLEDFAEALAQVPAAAAAEERPQEQPKADPAKARAEAERAAYEASKKEPLRRVKDEFDPGDDGGDPPDSVGHDPDLDLREEAKTEEQPVPGGRKGELTLAQLERFGKMKAELGLLGVDEQTLWNGRGGKGGINNFSAQTFNKTVAELGDFSSAEYEVVHGYLARWRGALVAARDKAAEAEKKGGRK